jgi:hypothetical protein
MIATIVKNVITGLTPEGITAEQEIKRRQRHLDLRPAHDQIVGKPADVARERTHHDAEGESDQYADKAHTHADARAVHDAREEVAAQPIAAHQEVRLVGRLGGEEMAVVEKPHVGLAREVGRENARRRVAQAHRMGVKKSVHPLGRPRHMKTHRRAIGQVAILANRIVGRDDGRRGGEEIERQQTDDREPHHPRGAPPLAAQPIEERAGA